MKRPEALKTTLVFAVLLILAATPWVLGNRYVFHVATMVTIMVPMALSLNLMLKLGQLSMAQPAFMGIGAYASALLAARLGVPPLLCLLAAGLLAAGIALVTGVIFLRIKGVYFVLLTFAFGQIVNLVFQEWTGLFGGNSGLYGIPKLSLFGYRLTAVYQYYGFGLAMAAVLFLLMRVIERSDLGAIVESLNEDETLCRSMGSNALAWRVAAFGVSAFMAGLAGGLYAFYIGFLSPEAFGFRGSVDLILMNVVGGASSVLGPLLGAIVVVPLPELLREAKEYQLLIYGLCLIFFLVFLRHGIVSLIEKRRGVL